MLGPLRSVVNRSNQPSCCFVVLGTDPDPVCWDLPPAQLDADELISGGDRTMLELAVALAASGREVELRGPVPAAVLEELAGAAGARPRTPTAGRALRAEDVAICPNVGADPLRFARCVLSPARFVLFVHAPLGQFGWPFVGRWEAAPHVTVELASLSQPAHYRALAGLGVDVWTHIELVHSQACAAGVRSSFVGNGDPLPPSAEPAVKDVPIAYLEGSRWRSLAERAAALIGDGVRAIPSLSRPQLLAELARVQVLLWPARVEGHGRVLQEARGLGVVVVALSSNVYATGLDGDHGAVAVESIEQMADVARRLLADPGELRRLAEAGRRSSREQVDWESYVARVDRAAEAVLTRPDDPASGALAAFGARIGAQLRVAGQRA